MDYTTWWTAQSHWFWIIPILFMVLMLVCMARMIRCAGAWRRSSGHGAPRFPAGWCNPGSGSMARWWAETPKQVLDRRYASGEITREQYEQMKRDIESRGGGINANPSG